jgi:type IV secretion system protein VirB10
MAERWAAMHKQLAQMHADIAALKQKPAPKPAAAEPPKPQPKKHASMLYLQHTPKDEPAAPTPTYTLAPGATKLACQVETVMNSDTGQTFTARTLTPVYDTATGHHLLIPQNSTILGKYDGAGLLYGNERLPTLSLSLTLPNGQTVDLGESPVTNGAGTAGLVTSVNQHYGRLLGAVFIGGALRGGAMALTAGLAGAGPAGYVAAGVAQSASQALQRTQGRALDTRPTITVDAGELCQVILLKPLQLPANQ